ncbi:MAG: asparagine synthase (glutamine-hydrolyzing) [Nitrospirae bacterium]|nr:asparagine synthase (glutamine-hydrolyzing) [Nitrospirota bacterium]
MCGIAGFINKNNNICWDESLHKMTASLTHRGPDDEGSWIDRKAGVALGHRRLSILDLSPAGHQPMHSESGRYVIVFNGEIYNHNKIRKELELTVNSELRTQNSELIKWQGHSDTEVMLAAVEEWGVEDAVKRFIGMFAIALWDREERSLHLVRDRLGEKPLYYGWMDGIFLFASELKAIRAHPSWSGEIDRNALALLLRHNYVPAPYSIYKRIYKLLPGTVLTIDIDNSGSQSKITPKPYWQAKKVAEERVANPFQGSEAEAAEQLEDLLRDAVAQQMVADVPLGAFLSGGIDSSTIVAIMQAQSNRPVKTFTIGFHEEGYNEAIHAKAVARHMGTDHTELYVTPEEAMAVIPKLPALYDEPFSDSSQIPTFLVSQLARQYVTVSLSGDAGDELFGGYNRYFWGRSIWNKIGWLPQKLRNVMASSLCSLSPQQWDKLFAILRLKYPYSGDKLHKMSEILTVNSPEEMYRRLVSHWKTPSSVVLNAHEPPTLLTDRNQWAKLSDFTQRMMFFDMVTYLPDDILVKVDRASMRVGLESRIPFLDHRVVEFAWRIPLSMKIRNGQGKWLLRQVLYKYVPKELIERPKTGFGIPIDSWLRGPLRDWAEELLNENRLRQGFFEPAPIREKWTEHLSGRRNWQYHLWDVLMFQAWIEAQGHKLDLKGA